MGGGLLHRIALRDWTRLPANQPADPCQRKGGSPSGAIPRPGELRPTTERKTTMARFDQYIGLNDWARKTVLRKEKVRQYGVNVFADGRRKRFSRWTNLPVARIQVIGILHGVYTGKVADLHRYTMSNGKVYEEFVQATPWSGGPMYHIALRDVKTGKNVPESLWTDEEMGC